MAIVFALLIVGWLLAFALGSQSGFENQPNVEPVQSQSIESPASYRGTVSAS